MKRSPLIRWSVPLALLMHASITYAGTIRVNTNDWSDSRNGQVSLREAALIGGGQIRCMTQAERNQISGCNIVVTLPSGSCSYNPLNETRYELNEINANCGPSHTDNIVFDDAVTNINLGSSVEIWTNDGIDGGLSNGAMVRLSGPGAGGWSGPAIRLADAPATTGSIIRKLRITGFNGDGIFFRETDGAVFEGLEIFSNLGHGIAIGPSLFGETVIWNTTIGTTDGTLPNHIYSNGGFGIRLVDEFNDGSSRFNRIQSTFIGMKPGDTSVDLGNTLGGIEIINVPGSRIGGFSEPARLFVAWNDGPGIHLNGTNARNNTIAGVTVGLRPDGNAGPNLYGIELANGAHDNALGLNGEDRNVIAGNTNHGIRVYGNSDNNRIEANFIGMTQNLLAARPNGQDGITILSQSSGNIVESNVIAGNGHWGIWTHSAESNSFINNAIGVRGTSGSANDVVATPNLFGGISLNLSDNNIVGPGNVIAANQGPGLHVSDSDANGLLVRGNRIGLDGAGAASGNTGDGIRIEGGADNIDIGSMTIADRNLIGGNSGDGIDVDGASNDVQILGNRIGTDSVGTAARTNAGNGVLLRNGVTGSVVRANLISGNGNDGVKIEGNSDGNDVLVNTIGLNATRTAMLANAWSGVALLSGASGNRVGDGTAGNQNTIAGNSTAVFIADSGTTGNLINNNHIGFEGTAGNPVAFGNTNDGVFIGDGANNTLVANNSIVRNADVGIELSGADNCTIRGNRIGIGSIPTASTPHPNGRGIRVTAGASGTVIGGATPATDRNVVSSNTFFGIGLFNPGTTSNTILNNWVGLTLSGEGDAGNGNEGILIQEQATNSTVSANVVSGNAWDGIRIRHSGTTGHSLQRNLIGMSASDAAIVSNGGAGIHVDSLASFNTIGFLQGQGNTIRFNTGDGVWIESGTGNAISFNILDTNSGLGIDLGADGVNTNDAGDTDTGANTLLNHPVLSNVSRGGGMISFTASLSSTGNRTYGLQFFHNFGCDLSGRGEAQHILGDGQIVLPAGGTASANFMIPLADNISATTITALAFAADDTSEFSPCAATGITGDAVFANGFEGSSSAAAEDKSVPVGEGFTATRLDDRRVRVIATTDRRLVPPGNTEEWQFGSAGPVVVDSIRASGADCRLAGAIRCALDDRGPVTIELVLAAPAGRFIGVFRERTGHHGRALRQVAP